MKAIFITILAASINFGALQQGPAEVKTLSATAYKKHQAKQKEAVLLDVRTPDEYSNGHLKGAQNVDFLAGDVEKAMQDWDKSQTYYIYCASGNRSGKAAKLMKEAGFENVYNIGGFKTLKEAGVPVQ